MILFLTLGPSAGLAWNILPWIPSSFASFQEGLLGKEEVNSTGHAVILFIGDGMGFGQRTAARWLAVGDDDGKLAMDDMSNSGWSRTSSADNIVTDSAAGATAIATGLKTNNGVIALDPSGGSLTTILEHARVRGMAVGLVTTTQITDATPAAFAAHVKSRTEKLEIARQLVEAKVDILLGGGEDDFLPTDITGNYPQPGKRTDGRNLISEAVDSGYTYAYDLASFSSLPSIANVKVLGLFGDEGMNRPFSPTLAQMTGKAIDILSQNPNGFFLLVEGGQIDWAGHANDATNAISDTLGLDQAVGVAKTYASNHEHILLVVTADHETGGMTPRLTPSGLAGEEGPFNMPDGTPFYVDWTTTSHTSSNVPVTAQGPWSNILMGEFENTHIFTAMDNALSYWVWLPTVRHQ